MALPASGAISLNAVNVELGLTGTTTISMNQTSVRTLFGKASGAISMSDGYGKSNRSTITYTLAANTQNASLNVTSGTAPAGGSVSGTYVAGKTDVNITVVSAVYLHSVTAGTPGLTLTGGSAGDVITLTNNGYIMGMGGVGGGSSGSASTYVVAGTGSTALKVGFNTTVVKGSGSYIGGGGGGGGGGRELAGGGGGAGGGVGGSVYDAAQGFGAGGLGGALNGSGGNGNSGGGGGGRIFPGTASLSAVITANNAFRVAGDGGEAGGGGSAHSYGGLAGGGGGGGWGASGGTGVLSSSGGSNNATGAPGGGGGSAGTNGTVSNAVTDSRAGAAGGKAIDFNGFSVTISGSGTTYGATS